MVAHGVIEVSGATGHQNWRKCGKKSEKKKLIGKKIHKKQHRYVSDLRVLSGSTEERRHELLRSSFEGKFGSDLAEEAEPLGVAPPSLRLAPNHGRSLNRRPCVSSVSVGCAGEFALEPN